MISFLSAYSDTNSDEDYIVQLYLKYERLMFAAAKRAAPELPSSWEDIVQDSLEKLIRHEDTLRTLEERSLLAYISITVRNTALNCRRRQALKDRFFTDFSEGDPEGTDPAAPSMEDLVILREERASLLEVWRSLSETDRLLLRGRYILQSTDGELAELLGCKPASIRMKLTRARRRALKSMLDKEGGPGDKT